MSSHPEDKKLDQEGADIRRKLDLLPDSPGVYLHKDKRGKVIYVGKAKLLSRRVRSYFRPAEVLDSKTRHLARRIVDFDYIITETEAAALILEDQLIKEYRPHYNIRLKDDKRYPYIRISMADPYPAVSITRKMSQDGSRYFGPYTDVGGMRHILQHVLRIFQVRTCDLDLPEHTVPRPCLDYQIHRCPAPCVAYEAKPTYRQRADLLARFLNGDETRVVQAWTTEMKELAAAQRFEEAAAVRDRLDLLAGLIRNMGRIGGLRGDLDICGVARDGSDGCGVVMRIRGGRIRSTAAFNFEDRLEQATPGFMAQLLREYYPRAGELPPLILLSHDPGDLDHWRQWLSGMRGGPLKLVIPKRGPKSKAVILAVQNATHKMNERLLRDPGSGRRIAPGTTTDLQEALGLHRTPETMECFDISTIGGNHSVGSLVYFRNTKPLKSRYRRFRIRTVEGTDDYASMREVLSRYYAKLSDSGLETADLIIIDGGKGQLGVAQKVLAECGFSRAEVIGLSKREETVHFPDGSEINLPAASPALKLLQRIRDEAHRFAITYHRNLRDRQTMGSELDMIPGIGPIKKLALLHHFGSLAAIRTADSAALQDVRGLGATDAQRILNYFNLNKSK